MWRQGAAHGPDGRLWGEAERTPCPPPRASPPPLLAHPPCHLLPSSPPPPPPTRQGREGKVTTVYRRKWVIHVNGLTREKVNGSQAQVPVQPSKCVITKLKMDKDRTAILARKGKGGGVGKGKFSEAEVAAMEAVE